MNDTLFQKAVPLLERLEQAGYEAYFVGGCVRDYYLGRPINDIDIATSALPEEVKEIFPNTVDVGIEHGTVLVLHNGEGYEVTTFRAESDYKDFRRPEKVVFIGSLYEDLKRRDFTMNAMAMDRTGRVVDPFNGKEAIRHRQIVTVGKAEERFSEDALRMMRAARFASQLGFDLEDGVFTAICHNAGLMQHIAVERKRNEFEKLISGRFRKKGLKILLETELYLYLPGLESNKKELEKMLTIDCTSLTLQQMWLLIAVLFSGDKPVEFLKAWKLPSKTIKYLLSGLTWMKNRRETPWTRWDVYDAGLSVAVDVEKVHSVLYQYEDMTEQIQTLYDNLPIKHRKELSVNGQDLCMWFQKKPGPWLRACLEEIEKAVLDQKTKNEKEKIKEWLKKCNRL
ncbi:CCA tRNA nucleotidyltransferase [Bacillus smithii]|uniref:CCA tRNA nucleotidyltransferase n=1 Tax=Bacillus smithii TaxID=1479 RepID=UPI0030C8E3DA